MHFPLRLTPLLLFSLLLAFLPSHAADTSLASSSPKQPKHKWNWLSENDKARLLTSIPAKPAPGSALDQQDLQTVLQIQATRTPQDIAEAQDDKKFRLDIVARVLTPGFTKGNYPVTFALLDKVNEDESFLNSTLKKENKRKRPYQDHPEVKPLFEVDQYSYPSGHSSGAHTLADILALLFPDKKDALYARADAVGHSRIVAGVHYPSDVEEGEKLAQALTDALVANPDFQKALADAKAEVAREATLNPQPSAAAASP